MAQRGPLAPRGRRIYIKGIGAVVDKGNGSFVFRTAPQRRKLAQTQAQKFATGTMSAAAWFTKLATPWEYQTAKDLAGQSGFTWKDMLISSFFGNAVEFTDVNGVQWTGRRILAADIQQLLDSISATPGAVLVRTANGWAVLLPGDANKVLTMDASTGLPDWQPSQSGVPAGGAIASATAFIPPPMTLHSTATFSFNNFGARSVWLPRGIPVTAIKTLVRTANATAKMTPAIYSDVNGTITALQASGAQVTGATAGINSWPITWTPPADGWYWIGYVLTVSSLVVAAAQQNADNCFFADSGAPPSTAPAATYGSGGLWSAIWLGHP